MLEEKTEDGPIKHVRGLLGPASPRRGVSVSRHASFLLGLLQTLPDTEGARLRLIGLLHLVDDVIHGVPCKRQAVGDATEYPARF